MTHSSSLAHITYPPSPNFIQVLFPRLGMDPYTLSKSRWSSRKNLLKGKNHRGINCGCWCCRTDRYDRHHVRPRLAWYLRDQYRLPKGKQALSKVSPSALLDWFWDPILVDEDDQGDEGEVDGDGEGWGELSFAFGVRSSEYEDWGEMLHAYDFAWGTDIERSGEDGWDVVSDGFSDWEEVEDN